VAPIPPDVNLSTSSGAIVALADLATLEVEVDVAEANVAKLSPSQPADVTVEAFPEKQYQAALRQIIPTADRTKVCGTWDAVSTEGSGYACSGGIQMLQRFAVLLSTAGMVVTIACAQSDPGVATAVKSKLAADDTVKAYQIDVDTKDRIVTLSGTVETAAAKDQAVMIARQTDGVRDVVDHIAVNRDAAATTGNLREEANEAGREAREKAREAADAAKEPRRSDEGRRGCGPNECGADRRSGHVGCEDQVAR
jgi:hypothetical protein